MKRALAVVAAMASLALACERDRTTDNGSDGTAGQSIYPAIPHPAHAFSGFDPIGSPAPAPPEPWDQPRPGWYYVDPSADGCSDAGTGTPSAPRCTIPQSLTPGDVVVIAPGPHRTVISLENVRGTPDAPVFVMGLRDHPATFEQATAEAPLRIHDCSYVVFENLIFDGNAQDLSGSSEGSVIEVQESSDHLVFRHITIRDYPEASPCDDARAAVVFSFSSSWEEGDVNQYHVIYDLTMEGYRAIPWPPSCESGGQGVVLIDGVDHIWILDSYFRDIAEDAIHIIGLHGRHDASQKRGPHDGLPNDIFIGGCEFDRAGENAVDIKESVHVVVSSCVMHGFRDTKATYGWPGAAGQAVVINDEGYDNTRDESASETWIVNNEIYDSVLGITDQSGHSSYLVGNVIHDLVVPSSTEYDSYAIMVSKANRDTTRGPEWIVNNTVWNVPGGGILVTNAWEVHVENNVVSETDVSAAYSLRLVNVPGQATVRANVLWDPDGARYTGFECDRCLEEDPALADPGGGNFTPTERSVCVDAGVESEVYSIHEKRYGLSIALDRNGTPRPQGEGWDIGALERSNHQ